MLRFMCTACLPELSLVRSGVAQDANQLLFLKAEGIELMILTIKERRFAWPLPLLSLGSLSTLSDLGCSWSLVLPCRPFPVALC